MTSIRLAVAATVALSAPTAVFADTFDFETRASFVRSDLSFTSNGIALILIPPLIPFPDFTADNQIEADLTTLSGTWFFSGVTINEGPRTRAAFLSRASSLSVELGRVDTTFRTRVDFADPAIPDQNSSGGPSSDVLALSGRYVWQDTGWYGLAGVATSDDDDTDSFQLGVGRYLSDRTSVDLSARQVEFFNNRITTFTLGLSHVADLTGQWQYGADLRFSQADSGQAELLTDATFSLYPTRSLAFGLEYGTSLEDIGGAASYAAFVSWFANESFEVNARLGTTDQNTLFGFYQDSWGVGFRFRF